jgi:hypothetical protein
LAVGNDVFKRRKFQLFAEARPVDSHDQWVANVKSVWKDLKNLGVQWWEELRMWCSSIQSRAVHDMAFHDKQFLLKT